MKFQPAQQMLRDLLSDFSRGAILLPQFQRDYVWKVTKIRNLLDSLLRGFPIGGFYLWRPDVKYLDPKPKAFGEAVLAPDIQSYLIDGQQRLTSLEAAFDLFSGEDKNCSELRCYLDLAAHDVDRSRDTRLFVSYGGNRSVARRVDLGDSTLVPLNLLYKGPFFDLRNTTESSLNTLKWNSERVAEAMRRFDSACAMLEQQVQCTTIYDVKDEEAVEVFSRLNKGGAPLRRGDVEAAALARGRAVDVLKKMRDFVSEQEPIKLGFGFSFAFRALVVFHRQSAQFSTLRPDWVTMAGPDGRSVLQSWRAAEDSLKKALKFVDEMGWCRRALLPSANAVIVLAAALEKDSPHLTAEDERVYRRWLILTTLNGVFQGSVESTINRFLRAIERSTNKVSTALVESLKRGHKVKSESFFNFSQILGPPTQVLHAWLVGQSAVDWMNGEPIDSLARRGEVPLPTGDLTVHHIFPRKLLADNNIAADQANCAANYALISRPSNAAFKDRPPDEVLRALNPEQRRRAKLQFFGEEAGDRLRVERYEDFCQWRAGRLAESINRWLGIE